MNKIKKSMSTVLPTKQQKSRMLNNILSKRNKRVFNPILILGPTLATILFVFVIQDNKDIVNNVEPRSKGDAITINDKDYCEGESFIGNVNDLDRLYGVLPGGEVYQTKKGTLVIFVNNEYMEYSVCEGE